MSGVFKRAVYSAGGFEPLGTADLCDGQQTIVLLTRVGPQQHPERPHPYVRCHFKNGRMVPEAPLTLREGEEVDYYEAVVPEVIAPGITRHANIRFGRACIEGSRLAVMDIAALADQGLIPEEILIEYPGVTLEQIEHALAYYRAHPEETEAEFEEQERAFEEMDRKWEEYVAGHGGNAPAVPHAADRGIARPVEAKSLVDGMDMLAKESLPFAHPIRFIRIKEDSDGNDG
jgi:uncharacterized protein (DUF433 family)